MNLEGLSHEVNTNLCILNCAVQDGDSDLEICDLTNFIEQIYKKSKDMLEIFANPN